MTTSTYEETTPRKPSLQDDLFGAAFQNDPKNPPNKLVHPSAEWANQGTLLTHAHSQTVAMAVLYVTNSGTAYTVSVVECVNKNAVGTDFVVARASAGVLTVKWASTVIPTVNVPPIVQPVGTGSGQVVVPLVSFTTGGVNVEMYNLSGTATDRSFVLVIH